MGSRFFLPIPVKRRKNASRISRPCTMPTTMPNKRDLGVLSVRTIYKQSGRATRVKKGDRQLFRWCGKSSLSLYAEADAVGGVGLWCHEAADRFKQRLDVRVVRFHPALQFGQLLVELFMRPQDSPELHERADDI